MSKSPLEEAPPDEEALSGELMELLRLR